MAVRRPTGKVDGVSAVPHTRAARDGVEVGQILLDVVGDGPFPTTRRPAVTGVGDGVGRATVGVTLAPPTYDGLADPPVGRPVETARRLVVSPRAAPPLAAPVRPDATGLAADHLVGLPVRLAYRRGAPPAPPVTLTDGRAVVPRLVDEDLVGGVETVRRPRRLEVVVVGDVAGVVAAVAGALDAHVGVVATLVGTPTADVTVLSVVPQGPVLRLFLDTRVTLGLDGRPVPGTAVAVAVALLAAALPIPPLGHGLPGVAGAGRPVLGRAGAVVAAVAARPQGVTPLRPAVLRETVVIQDKDTGPAGVGDTGHGATIRPPTHVGVRPVGLVPPIAPMAACQAPDDEAAGRPRRVARVEVLLTVVVETGVAASASPAVPPVGGVALFRPVDAPLAVPLTGRVAVLVADAPARGRETVTAGKAPPDWVLGTSLRVGRPADTPDGLAVKVAASGVHLVTFPRVAVRVVHLDVAADVLVPDGLGNVLVAPALHGLEEVPEVAEETRPPTEVVLDTGVPHIGPVALGPVLGQVGHAVEASTLHGGPVTVVGVGRRVGRGVVPPVEDRVPIDGDRPDRPAVDVPGREDVPHALGDVVLRPDITVDVRQILVVFCVRPAFLAGHDGADAALGGLHDPTGALADVGVEDRRPVPDQVPPVPPTRPRLPARRHVAHGAVVPCRGGLVTPTRVQGPAPLAVQDRPLPSGAAPPVDGTLVAVTGQADTPRVPARGPDGRVRLPTDPTLSEDAVDTVHGEVLGPAVGRRPTVDGPPSRPAVPGGAAEGPDDEVTRTPDVATVPASGGPRPDVALLAGVHYVLCRFFAWRYHCLRYRQAKM